MKRILLLVLTISLISNSTLLCQTVTTRKWSNGTLFDFTFTYHETKQLASNWGYCINRANFIIQKINHMQGGDLGVEISLRIAKTKVAWDLSSISNKVLQERGLQNWTYTMQRDDNLAGAIVVADNIAKIWRDATSSHLHTIVGYVERGLTEANNFEKAFFAGDEFTISVPYQGIRNWNFSISGSGADPTCQVGVYIYTNQEYFQGYAHVRPDGRWELTRSYPTRRAHNSVYAKIIKDGVVVAITPTVKIMP